ncbi:hypothetical protein LXA43DRAFT_1098574 [Ganoderma leucocontextum]|nr:hypothetical protein LXA43DRAFT_1098574 [Ganoderma leucocontextum]
MKPLPPEVWGLIVKQLERNEQKTCRTLSKLHHDFASRALFAHVNVYFGLWSHEHDMTSSEETVSEIIFKNNTTWDILRHISLFPDFAKVVKTISVRAYLSPGIGVGEDVFHTRALIAALHALRNLRAFHWHGCFPRLSQDVLIALAQSSGHSLKELHIPITNATAPCLSAFCGLQELRSVDVRWPEPSPLDEMPAAAFPDEWPVFSMPEVSSDIPPGEASTRALQMAVDGMAHTLTAITMAGDILWGCSIRSMLGLQELEVILPETSGGLALVLRHCFLLRSFTVFPRAPDELFSVLQADPTALPRLRAFKFLYCSIKATSPFESRHAQALARFIQNKPQLASLDVEAIAHLPRLEVLGFTLLRSAWGPGDIQFFRERLPRGLTALRLSVSLDQADNDSSLQEWLGLLKDLASLRYLHIFDKYRTFDLKQQLLEDPPASLELVGYGPFLRWLVRDHGDNDPDDSDRLAEYSPSWPLSKVQFRSADDFGRAEWEWLLRWHGAFNIVKEGLVSARHIRDMGSGVMDDRESPITLNVLAHSESYSTISALLRPTRRFGVFHQVSLRVCLPD